MAAPLRCIVIICGQSFGQKRQPPCFLAPQGIHWASIKSERKSTSSPAGFPAAVRRFLDFFPRHTKGGSTARVQVYSLLQHIHMGANSEQLFTPVMQLRRRVVEKWVKVWDMKRLWLRAAGAYDSDKLSSFILLWPSWEGQGAPKTMVVWPQCSSAKLYFLSDSSSFAPAVLSAACYYFFLAKDMKKVTLAKSFDNRNS